MILDLQKYEKYLVADDKGFILSEQAPSDYRSELISLNKEYKHEYGEAFIRFEPIEE